MLTRDDVKKIAVLAKLSPDVPEMERMSGELTRIIGFVEKLNEMNLKNIEATSHAVSITNVFRDDAVRSSNIQPQVFKLAPDVEENLFKVPRVIE